MAIAAFLNKNSKNSTLLNKIIHFTRAKTQRSGHAPITSTHLTTGMTVLDLCAAAIEYSDNTAINLLLKILKGPDGVNAFARSIGDNTFRLDRFEPELNTARPNDLRDISTLRAMATALLRRSTTPKFPQNISIVAYSQHDG